MHDNKATFGNLIATYRLNLTYLLANNSLRLTALKSPRCHVFQSVTRRCRYPHLSREREHSNNQFTFEKFLTIVPCKTCLDMFFLTYVHATFCYIHTLPPFPSPLTFEGPLCVRNQPPLLYSSSLGRQAEFASDFTAGHLGIDRCSEHPALSSPPVAARVQWRLCSAAVLSAQAMCQPGPIACSALITAACLIVRETQACDTAARGETMFENQSNVTQTLPLHARRSYPEEHNPHAAVMLFKLREDSRCKIGRNTEFTPSGINSTGFAAVAGFGR